MRRTAFGESRARAFRTGRAQILTGSCQGRGDRGEGIAGRNTKPKRVQPLAVLPRRAKFPHQVLEAVPERVNDVVLNRTKSVFWQKLVGSRRVGGSIIAVAGESERLIEHGSRSFVFSLAVAEFRKSFNGHSELLQPYD